MGTHVFGTGGSRRGRRLCMENPMINTWMKNASNGSIQPLPNNLVESARKQQQQPQMPPPRLHNALQLQKMQNSQVQNAIQIQKSISDQHHQAASNLEGAQNILNQHNSQQGQNIVQNALHALNTQNIQSQLYQNLLNSQNNQTSVADQQTSVSSPQNLLLQALQNHQNQQKQTQNLVQNLLRSGNQSLLHQNTVKNIPNINSTQQSSANLNQTTADQNLANLLAILNAKTSKNSQNIQNQQSGSSGSSNSDVNSTAMAVEEGTGGSESKFDVQPIT